MGGLLPRSLKAGREVLSRVFGEVNMRRSEFLKLTLAGATASWFPVFRRRGYAMVGEDQQVSKRLYRGEERISVIGFGGILCLGLSARESADLVAEAALLA